MKHKIAFIDMDGTLYQTENDIIQDSSIQAIKALKKAGYLVCAATGRPLNQMKLILEKVQFDYYILINGGYIVDKNYNLIQSFPLPQSNVEDLVKLAKEKELGLMFHFGDATYIYNQFYPMYDFCKYCNVLDSLFYDPTHSYHKRHSAYNCVLMSKSEKPIQQYILEHTNLRSDLINVKTDGFCFDVFNKTNDKSKGIEIVLAKENLTWKDAICFGDSTNDVGMFKKADISVAMGSASDYVKSCATFSTTDVYNDGVYNAVQKILNEELQGDEE